MTVWRLGTLAAGAAAAALLLTACSGQPSQRAADALSPAGAASPSAGAVSPSANTASPSANTASLSASPRLAPAPAASSAASRAAGAAPSAATAGTCAKWAAARTFFHATRAVLASGGSLTLTGQRATVVCGGLDDLHYVDSAATTTAHVVPDASIERIVCGTPKGCVDKPISAGQLPSYLAGTPETGIFDIKGPLTAITAMSEEYHP